MIIGIIGAMEQEVKFLLDMIDECKISLIGRYKIYTGLINNIRVILIQSGVSKTVVAVSTTILVNFYKPDIIINIGTAAGISLDLKIGDIVIADQVCFHDVDLTTFGYSLGQVCGYPKTFFTDKNLVFQMAKCSNQLKFNMKVGLIVSGDIFINGTMSLIKICKNFPKAIAIEMESAAIALVCYDFQIPFIVIRSITDFADKKSNLIFKKHLINSSKKCCVVIDQFLKTYK
ncbi:5'-methylthioadenosine/S-adenosylhomocysteine nucleosidase [Candidatus Pantoea edessiphila]|uniref:adenosylhomocysteine nucleosidase n=1 Tax=Candidatus Pantoea edessiphila TaxID=2044610 RepID=A0A2P5SY14_9GAMM|nr:5'-methylthioadenosine/adenosylhomocysteine nucleosidase [Candidatus Pantoea edessiphila]MBK4775573.1 5'-methylthioadenosine/adenosylhomocysteine nucleosidase [Pantoea sp. Edef]PPI87226.1 5'-methylthioadenosine/S-adenosylhomocysteine nucleosidase [Candidatus Pantoea edessiphila]